MKTNPAQAVSPALSKGQILRMTEKYFDRLSVVLSAYRMGGEYKKLLRIIRENEKDHRGFSRGPQDCGLKVGQAVEYFVVHYMMEQMISRKEISLSETTHLNEGFCYAYGLFNDCRAEILAEFTLDEAKAFEAAADYAELMKTGGDL